MELREIVERRFPHLLSLIELSRAVVNKTGGGKRYVVINGEALSVSLPTLSSQEMAVLEMLGEGWHCKKIAGEMFISYKTVETYQQNLRRKLSEAMNLTSYISLMDVRVFASFLWALDQMEEKVPA